MLLHSAIFRTSTSASGYRSCRTSRFLRGNKHEAIHKQEFLHSDEKRTGAYLVPATTPTHRRN